MDPALSFTLPSIADNLELNCRLYHPPGFESSLEEQLEQPAIRGAIVAHPYAPLGGCFDDQVVLSVTKTLLRLGFVVGTFNFRGAPGSQGRTSWTGKAEQDDYATFIGFMLYYLAGLNDIRYFSMHSSDDQRDVSAISTPKKELVSPDKSPLRLLLGGYSYGSLVLAQLSEISSIQSAFDGAPLGTPAAEVIMRARTLAQKSRAQCPLSPDPIHSRKSMHVVDGDHRTRSPVTVGGQESLHSSPSRKSTRHSRNSSLEKIRRSLESPRRSKVHSRSNSGARPLETAKEDISSPVTYRGISPPVQVSYLFISPVLVPLTSTLLPPGALNFGLNLGFGSKKVDVPSEDATDVEVRSNRNAAWLHNPTLAVFGDGDGFSSVRRLRGWAEQAASKAAGKLEWESVAGAGHFWREDGAMQTLRQRLADWISSSAQK